MLLVSSEQRPRMPPKMHRTVPPKKKNVHVIFIFHSANSYLEPSVILRHYAGPGGWEALLAALSREMTEMYVKM